MTSPRRFGTRKPRSPPTSPPCRRYTGVKPSGRYWIVRVRVEQSDKNRICLREYATAEIAARAYDAAAICMQGCKSTLDFPDSPPSVPVCYSTEDVQRATSAAAAAAASATSTLSLQPGESLIPSMRNQIKTKRWRMQSQQLEW